MDKKRFNELYEKIEKLERTRMGYLEIDDKAGARRIEKQIENLEQEIEFSKFEKVKQELEVYKSIVKKFPEIHNQIKDKLLELKINDLF